MARGRKSPIVILLSYEEREQLQSWQRSTTISAGLSRRSRVILLLSEGRFHTEISRLAGIQRRIIRKWANRFLEKRIVGLSDAPGRGGKSPFSPGSRLSFGSVSL